MMPALNLNMATLTVPWGLEEKRNLRILGHMHANKSDAMLCWELEVDHALHLLGLVSTDRLGTCIKYHSRFGIAPITYCAESNDLKRIASSSNKKVNNLSDHEINFLTTSLLQLSSYEDYLYDQEFELDDFLLFLSSTKEIFDKCRYVCPCGDENTNDNRKSPSFVIEVDNKEFEDHLKAATSHPKDDFSYSSSNFRASSTDAPEF